MQAIFKKLSEQPLLLKYHACFKPMGSAAFLLDTYLSQATNATRSDYRAERHRMLSQTAYWNLLVCLNNGTRETRLSKLAHMTSREGNRFAA